MTDATAPRRPFPVRLFVWSLALVFAGSGGLYMVWELIIAPRKKIELQLQEKDKEIAAQAKRIGDLKKEMAKLQTYLKLLKHAERRAQIEVLKQEKDADGQTINTLRFREIRPDGTPVGPAHEFELAGEEVYLDTLIIKFEDHFIEEGDPLKGKALLLIRRVFSNSVPPDKGYRLDKEYKTPPVFAAEQADADFEAELWKRFWEVANSEELQKKYGVRAVHGQAPYGKLKPNKVYSLLLRSTGDVSIPAPTELQHKEIKRE